MNTPKPMEGTWVLVAPNGREYTGLSPIHALRAEQQERVPAAASEPVDECELEALRKHAHELRQALRALAALNAWHHFGECRAWGVGPIISPHEADELARRVLRV